nr:hypothetical protein GCM10025730_49330 [Promicromonospora thailandica]
MTDTIVEPTYDWAAPYAGLGDDALKALGNAGLLRRARKALADDAVTVTSADAQGAVLDVAGATVQVDGRGPAAVSCACPTAGVCQHVLTACLWAAGVAPAGGPDSGGPGAGGSGAGVPGVGVPGAADRVRAAPLLSEPTMAPVAGGRSPSGRRPLGLSPVARPCRPSLPARHRPWPRHDRRPRRCCAADGRRSRRCATSSPG